MAEKSRKSRARPSGVAYEGRVTAKVMHGNKVVRTIRSKNAGTVPLMRFLAGCLAGNYVPTDRPNYAAALKESKESDEGLAPLSPFPVPSSTATTHSGTASGGAYATASLSFVMSGLSLGNGTICGYALYDSRNASSYNAGKALGTYSALVSLPEEDRISLSSGENLVITWDLTLANADFGEVTSQAGTQAETQSASKATKAKSRKQG